MDTPPTSLAEYVHPPSWAMRDFRSASLESLAREAPVRFHCLLAAATRAAGEARDGGVTRPLSYLEWRFCTHRSTDPFPFQLCRATLLVQRGQSSALRPSMCASYGSSAGDLNTKVSSTGMLCRLLSSGSPRALPASQQRPESLFQSGQLRLPGPE
jgi:hypothetical protein